MSKAIVIALLALVAFSSATFNFGRCPAQGDFSDANSDNVHLTLLVDDAFTSDPINGDNLRGFSQYLGFNEQDTRKMFYAGINHAKFRFGIDATACPWDPVTLSCYLAPNPANPTNGWIVVPAGDNRTTVAITPVSYSPADTYRVIRSSTVRILTVPELGIFPTVRLAQWIYTFLGPVNISGQHGAEMNPSKGYFTLKLDEGQTVGDGIAFGRYAICGGVRNYTFDMRSFVVSRRWPGAADAKRFYYTEKFQLGSLQTDVFPDGSATLEIVYPSGVVRNTQGKQIFPWYVYSNWRLGANVAYSDYSKWELPCGAACNTKTVPAGGSDGRY